MTSREPSHSIHVAVVRFVDPFIGGVGVGSDDPISGDAESIAYWGYMIDIAWVLVGFAWMFATAAVAVVLQLLVSHGAGDIALCAGIGAIFFCVAGCANALWRRYTILPEARRLAERGADDASRAVLRRALPPNQRPRSGRGGSPRCRHHGSEPLR